MRLILFALGVVGGFVFGAWCLAILLPTSPARVKVAAVMVWLFVLIAFAFWVGNQKGRTGEERREFHYIVKKNFVYLAIAVVPVTTLFALAMHDVDAGIQRHIKQNWVLCTLTAFLVVGISIEGFWRIRRVWQMWSVLAAYTALHFSIGVPALAHVNKIRGGYISLIVMPELLLVSFILSSIEDRAGSVLPPNVNE